ncbi:hypothetical protein KSP39_PZI022620 [Platanthera zijinensis]|uniref:Tf2-1-like SH3-like domain-containing protein n=1 Tax=Platanthera zijinensis TaxID=2320716 RepID=A0AAP0AUC4_9ASPA
MTMWFIQEGTLLLLASDPTLLSQPVSLRPLQKTVDVDLVAYLWHMVEQEAHDSPPALQAILDVFSGVFADTDRIPPPHPMDNRISLQADHHSLWYHLKQKIAIPTLVWMAKLLGYDFSFEFRVGSSNHTTERYCVCQASVAPPDFGDPAESRTQSKLVTKFYGPFEIVTRVGTHVYRLCLPPDNHIHLVLHVSQLKRVFGDHLVEVSLPPPVFGLTSPDYLRQLVTDTYYQLGGVLGRAGLGALVSFDEPSNVPPSNKSETELMEEERACQSLLIIFSRAAGVRESEGFQSLSLEDMENYGLFQWEMGHCWLQKHV